MLLHHLDRVVEVREEQRVDDEARPVAAVHGVLAHPGADLADGGVGVVGGQYRTDHLDELHGRRRVEEVHADHVPRPGRGAGAGDDGQRGGGRREHRAGPADLVERPEHLLLDRQLLGDRLDGEVRVREGVQGRRRRDRGQRRVPRRGAQPPLVDRAAERLRDPRLRRLGLLRGTGHERDGVAGLGEDLGDAGGHGARADDADGAHLAAGRGSGGGGDGTGRVRHGARAARLLVGVEAAPGLAAGQPGLGELAQHRGGRVQPVARGAVHRLQDRTGRVHADQVEQRERPHRQAAAQFHGGVDVLAGGVPGLVHGGGLVEVAEQQPVRDEPGPVADGHGLLAQLAGESGDGGDGGGRGQHAGDHLDEFHGGRGVEEVQPQDALGAGRVGREPGHRERVGAGGQDGVRPDQGVEGGEDLVLERVLLRYDLDDEVGVGGATQIGAGAEAGEEVTACGFGETLALDGTGGGGFEGRHGPRGRRVADVDPDDLTAGPGEDFGDAAAHGAEADDGDLAQRAHGGRGGEGSEGGGIRGGQTVHRETPGRVPRQQGGSDD